MNAQIKNAAITLAVVLGGIYLMRRTAIGKTVVDKAFS